MANTPENPNQESDKTNMQQEIFPSESLVAVSVSHLTPPEKIYTKSQDGQIRQGEIISNLTQVKLNVRKLREGRIVGDSVIHSLAVVISQDCDCEQDYKPRSEGQITDKIIPNILFCEVFTAEQLKGNYDLNSKIWNQVKNNKNERYQFLEKILPEDDALEQGLPELGLDFKRYFTIPTDEIYYRLQIGEANRRCRLVSPYMEHLATRFSYFLHRIALPNDHASE